MSITSAIVLFGVIWFLTYLVVIPIRLKTQGDLGQVVEGTQAGAPAIHNLGNKAWITTLITAVLWAIMYVIIATDIVTMDDIDLFKRFGPGSTYGTNG